MKRVLGHLTSVAILAFCISSVSADVVLYQTDFESPFITGDLAGQEGWFNHSGSGSLVQVIPGQAVELVHGGGSREDVSIGLGQTMGAGDTFNFSFDVIVNGTDDATTAYFAHFRNDGTGFNSRIFVTAPNAANQNFTFALGETSSSTPAAIFGTDFIYGVSYTLSGDYNFNSGISTLSVDGGIAINSSSQADPGEDIQNFSFRQASGNTSMIIDNLRVGSIPEPGSLGILAVIAGLGFIRRRK